MIIDSHCHAWRYWPYEPAVPDPEHRGRIEQLLWEMDRWGVDRAMLVCARIDHNPDNNDYGAYAVARYPDRLVQLADVDCSWWPTYHTPGAAARLRDVARRHPIVGFTHYVGEPDGWFESADGVEFFAAAAELDLIASIAASPRWQPAIRAVARRFPTLPILCHHLGGLRSTEQATELLRSAAVPNILIKVSGFHYSSAENWKFPYEIARQNFRQVAAEFGARRLCWGSDFPASRDMLTYRQSLEIVRSYGEFLGDDLDWVLGATLDQVLRTRRPVGG